MLLFASDGWIVICSAVAWDMSAFRALASRYESFGGMLAAAALAGATGGLILGRFIDDGHIRRAVWVNAACLVATVILKAGCGDDPILVLIAATISAVLGGLYIPSLMTAVYNMAKSSPCPLRFHFAREGGWDCGGTAACALPQQSAPWGHHSRRQFFSRFLVSFSRRCSSIAAVCRQLPRSNGNCRDLKS